MGKQAYLHNVASSVLNQIGGITIGGSHVYDMYDTDEADYPQKIWEEYGLKILSVVLRMGPSARGRIADCGVGFGDPSGSVSYKVINQNGGLEEMYNGSRELTLLASRVVAAAIVDILRASVRKMRDEAQAGNDELDRSERDYIHHGPKASSRSVTSFRSETTHHDGSQSVRSGSSEVSTGPRA